MNSVDRLLALRSAERSDQPTDYDWVVEDPVVGFLAPVLWRRRRDEIGGSVGEAGAKQYRANVARFVLFRERVQRIIAALSESGIPVIVLKGVLLAETLFDSPGLRAMGDIDLLVRHQDFTTAMGVLKRLGWQPKENNDKANLLSVIGSKGFDPAWQTGEWSLRDDVGFALDLHWHLSPSLWLRPAYRIDMDSVWQQAVPIVEGDLHGAYALSPVHTLAHLCLHIAHHGMRPLRAYLDIDHFVRREASLSGWKWANFVALARQWRIVSPCYHVLFFSKELLGTPIPEGALQALWPGRSARYRLALLLSPQALLQHPPQTLGARYPYLIRLALIDHLVHLIHVVWRLILPSSSWFRHRYKVGMGLWKHWCYIWKEFRSG